MVQKILVIDDSKLVHSMYSQLLKRYKCEFVHAMNGAEGMDKLAVEGDIDLILLDIDMPVMTGLQFLEKVRQEDIYNDIPIIVISTQGKEEDIKKGLELGANAYIIKPFETSDLYSLIDKIKAKSRTK